jgi:hypothetical protein
VFLTPISPLSEGLRSGTPERNGVTLRRRRARVLAFDAPLCAQTDGRACGRAAGVRTLLGRCRVLSLSNSDGGARPAAASFHLRMAMREQPRASGPGTTGTRGTAPSPSPRGQSHRGTTARSDNRAERPTS